MNRRLVLIAGTLLLSGCATLQPVAAPAGAGFELLEPLYSATAGRDMLAIRVASNGCTKKEDFAVFVEKTLAGPRIAFGRKTLDRCRSFAKGQIELMFTWSELGLDGRAPVFVANPLVSWTGPGSL